LRFRPDFWGSGIKGPFVFVPLESTNTIWMLVGVAGFALPPLRLASFIFFLDFFIGLFPS